MDNSAIYRIEEDLRKIVFGCEESTILSGAAQFEMLAEQGKLDGYMNLEFRNKGLKIQRCRLSCKRTEPWKSSQRKGTENGELTKRD